MSNNNPHTLFDYVADQLTRWDSLIFTSSSHASRATFWSLRDRRQSRPSNCGKSLKEESSRLAASNQIPPRRLSRRSMLIWSRSGVTSFRIRICRSASNWGYRLTITTATRSTPSMHADTRTTRFTASKRQREEEGRSPGSPNCILTTLAHQTHRRCLGLRP